MEKSGCVDFQGPILGLPAAKGRCPARARSQKLLLAAAAALVTSSRPSCPLSELRCPPGRVGPAILALPAWLMLGKPYMTHRSGMEWAWPASCCSCLCSLPTTALITSTLVARHPHPTPRATGNRSFHLNTFTEGSVFWLSCDPAAREGSFPCSTD